MTRLKKLCAESLPNGDKLITSPFIVVNTGSARAVPRDDLTGYDRAFAEFYRAKLLPPPKRERAKYGVLPW